MRTLGAVVHDARLSRDQTLREAAAVIGISAAYLSQIETGKKTPDTDSTVKKLADYASLEFEDAKLLAKVSAGSGAIVVDSTQPNFRVARATVDLGVAEDFSMERIKLANQVLFGAIPGHQLESIRKWLMVQPDDVDVHLGEEE